jgi:hypothetical protein
MTTKYKNCLGYDKRDYQYLDRITDFPDEEDIPQEYLEESQWNDVSMAILEFLRDNIRDMAIPVINLESSDRLELFDIIQLISAHTKTNTII